MLQYNAGEIASEMVAPMLDLFEGEFGVRHTQRYVEELLQVGHWSWDLNTGSMRWSRGLFDLLGLEAGVAKPSFAEFAQAVHPGDRHALAEAEQMLRQSIPVDRELRIISSSGRLRWIRLRAEPIAAAQPEAARAVGICHDISRQYQDVHLLRLTEQRLMAVARLSGVLAWIARADGSIVELLNFPVELGLSDTHPRPQWEELLHAEDIAAFREAWREGAEAKRSIRIDHRIRSANGNYIPCLSVANPTIDRFGQPQEWIGITRLSLSSSAEIAPEQRRLTGAQIRAARAILNWSVERLARDSGVRPGTIRRLESFDGASASDRDEMALLEKTLGTAGVEFLFSKFETPGVRPKIDRGYGR